MTDNQTSRVLFIGGTGPTQEQIAAALSTNPEFQLAEVLTRLERISIEVNAIEPDIIIIDHEITEGTLLDVVDDLSLRFPTTSTIVILPDDNPVAAQQVMLAGARAFIIKPFTQINLINTLRRVRTLDDARKRTLPKAGPTVEKIDRPIHAVTVFSPKGGAGVSTVATNLAIAHYQEYGGRVLLMEGKMFFGHLDVSLNILTGNTVADLVPHANNMDEGLVDDVVFKHASGIYVLLGPRNVQVAQGIRADNLFSVFMALQRQFDFIVIDGGNSLNENSVTFMDAADRILLLTTPDLPTLHDTSQFIQFSPTLAIPVEKILIVVNREGMIGGIRMRDIETSLHQDIFGSIADDPANTIRSINRGVPLLTRYPRSPASKGIKALVKKLARLSHVELSDSSLVPGGVVE